MVQIVYTEKAGEFMANLKVTENGGTVRDVYIPKPIIDLIKQGINDGTLNLTAIIARTANVVKDL